MKRFLNIQNLRRLERFYPLLIIVFLGYCIADLAILNVRDYMLPNQPPPSLPPKLMTTANQPKTYYTNIVTRNIFSSDGIIPDPVMAAGQDKKAEEAPILSSLPLNLVGTIVASDPDLSLANIEVKSKNQTLPYHPKTNVENLASVEKIERNKVIIRNLASQRLEYIEIKNEAKLSFGSSKPAGTEPTEVVQAVPGKFSIKRSTILKYTSNLSDLLQQASMTPKKKPNGDIECFQFLSINPDSIFTQLGLQVGDCIEAVNGVKIDSAGGAMDTYNKLKNAASVKVKYQRDGKSDTNDYSITE